MHLSKLSSHDNYYLLENNNYVRIDNFSKR